MEWTLDSETDLTPYGKKHISKILDLMGKKESATISPKDGRIHLSIPDANVRDAFTSLYESSPALQDYMEKEAFLESSTKAIRANFFRGVGSAWMMVKDAESAQKKEEAYQEFCRKEGVTEAEKKEAKSITADGVRKNDWVPALGHLQYGTILPHYGELLESLDGSREPFSALRDAANDLVVACEDFEHLATARNAFFLTDPKLDPYAAVAASIRKWEPDMDMDDLMAELRDSAMRDVYHKEGKALINCADRLIALRDEMELKLRMNADDERKADPQLTTDDVKELLMKTRDILGAYDYAEIREGYDEALDPVHPFQMGMNKDRYELLNAADLIDVLRERIQPYSDETPAGKAMREVFTAHPDNFDYRELTVMAVTKLMEKGAGRKTLREAAKIGRDVCPSIGEDKGILKEAAKRRPAVGR